MFETELTAAQQQDIMRRTGWSMAVVGCIRTMDEARIYMNAGLVEARIGGRPGENGACPPTWSGLIHPLLNRRTAQKRLRKRSISVQYR